MCEETDPSKRTKLAQRLKRYKDTRWDQFYPNQNKIQGLEELVLSVSGSLESVVSEANLQIEQMDRHENYFMAKIINIKKQEYEIYHAFE